MWPRLIVGVLPSTAAVDMDGTALSGTFPLTRGGCPSELDATRYLCNLTFYAGSADESVTLLPVVDGASIGEDVVPLREFNHCGRDIAYVELRLDGPVPAWSDVTYLNPCAAL
jgi:hypothetical protein